MNVLKSTPEGSPREASRDRPVPSTNRNRTGCTRDVTARSRSVRNLISSRRQTMLTARRSCRTLRSGTATLIVSVRASSSSAVAMSVVAICLPPCLSSAEPGGDPAVAVADRGLGVTDRLARVRHEHVVQRGPGHTHRPDGRGQAREQLGHEVLAGFDGERHQVLVYARLDAEHLVQRLDRRLVVGRADLHPVLTDGGLQRLRRVDRHDLAVVDDGDPVAVLGLVHIVRGEEDRDVLALLQVVDVLPDRHPGLRVQTHRGLVEEQHPRRVQQAAGDLQPPLHPAGVGGHHVAAPVPQADHLQHLAQPGLESGLRHPVQVGVETQVLLPRQVVVQGRVLEHQPDVAAYSVAFPYHVVACHPGGTRGGIRQGAQDLDRGGLAGAVRAEKPEGLPGRDLEVDAADGIDLAVLLGQRADLDGLRHTYASCSVSPSSAARIRYRALRVSARTLLACWTWTGVPAWATCTVAMATLRARLCSWTAASSTLPVTASQAALSSSAWAWT